MKLHTLSALGLTVTGDAEITGVSADNRDVRAGDLFVGVPGDHVHGARFASDAQARGAVAVLTDPAGAQFVPDGMPVAIASDVAAVLGRVASDIYGNPSERLRSFAVTGTNGKTTTAYMIDHILTRCGAVTGLVGTVALSIAGREIPARLTTPQPADLQRFLHELLQAGGTDLVMEVSSHALAQRRTDPIVYSVAGFTNLTQDHLDYHDTLDDYFEAKALLFEDTKSDAAVIWTDDDYGYRLYERLSNAVWVGRIPREGRGWLVEGDAAFTLRASTCATRACPESSTWPMRHSRPPWSSKRTCLGRMTPSPTSHPLSRAAWKSYRSAPALSSTSRTMLMLSRRRSRRCVTTRSEGS